MSASISAVSENLSTRIESNCHMIYGTSKVYYSIITPIPLCPRYRYSVYSVHTIASLWQHIGLVINYLGTIRVTGVVSWASAVRCEVQFTEKMESVPSRRTNALARFCIPCLTRRSMLS